MQNQLQQLNESKLYQEFPKDIPPGGSTAGGQRACATTAQLSALHHRGVLDLSVREPRARRARPAARRSRLAVTGRGDGQSPGQRHLASGV